jgi:hypothetical protein
VFGWPLFVRLTKRELYADLGLSYRRLTLKGAGVVDGASLFLSHFEIDTEAAKALATNG